MKRLIGESSSDVFLCNYICPPYSRDKELGFVGLFDSVYKSPIKYNFDYNYFKIFKNIRKIIYLGEKLGLPLKGLVVFCDWGLVDIEGIRSTLKTDTEISTQLSKFRLSIDNLFKKYPDMKVVSLSQLDIVDYLPLGLPYSYEERSRFLRNIHGIDNKFFTVVDKDFFIKILSWMDDKKLIQFLDWNNFSELNDWGIFKEDLVNILKTYNNVLWVKINKKYLKPTRNLIYLKENRDLRRGAFYSAILRYVEYKIYSHVISLRFDRTICLYQDNKFPMAGNHFRSSKMPILFLDPDHINNKLKFD
jgi:hypothetical protein